MKYTITGTLTLLSPLHIARPGEFSISADKPRYPNSGKANSMYPEPYTRTTAMRIPLTAENMAVVEEDKKARTMIEVPVIPANDLRGRIRRFAADVIDEVLIEKQQKVSRETYHCLRCGSASARPSSFELTLDEAVESSKHPFVGMWGGGPKLIRSGFECSTGWPILPHTAALGIVPELESESPFRDAFDVLDMTQPIWYRKVDDLLDFSDPLAPSVIDNYEQSALAWLVKVSENQKIRKEQRDQNTSSSEKEKKEGIKHFGAMEVIIPGVKFHVDFRIDTNRGGKAGLGIVLLALEKFANEQKLGGWTRNGFGRFATNLTIEGPGIAATPALNRFGSKYEINLESEIVEEAIDAWTKYRDTMDAGNIEAFYGKFASEQAAAK